MRKKFLSIILTVCLVLGLLPKMTIPVFAAEETPYTASAADIMLESNTTIVSGNTYTISDATQLGYLATIVNKGTNCSGAAFKLTEDIVLGYWQDKDNDGIEDSNEIFNDKTSGTAYSTSNWTPIGATGVFKGTFDGNHHTISGIYINAIDSRYQGLFGSVYGGAVKNVAVCDSYICGSMHVGGVVAYCDNKSTVENCYNTGSVSGSDSVGGVVGNDTNSTVENCYNTGSVSGSGGGVGGVVGYNFTNSTVQNCYNTGSVSGSKSVGGVVGSNYNSSTVQNCYNTGSVSGSGTDVGGLVGSSGVGSPVQYCYNTGSVRGSSSKVGGVAGSLLGSEALCCYNTGSVSGSESIGGVVGYVYSSKVRYCYNTGNVSGSMDVGGVGGTICTYSKAENCYNVGSVSGKYNVNSVGSLSDQSTVQYCYSDKQMCPGTPGTNEKLTSAMVGTSMFDNDVNWTTDPTLYPRLAGMDKTDDAYVWASPIFLHSSDTVASVTTDFTVGTENGVNWTSSDTAVISISGGTATVTQQSSATVVTLTASKGNVSRTVKVTVKAYDSTISKSITIGTTAPIKGAAISNGTNTPPTGASAPVVTWSANGGSTYTAASGNFAGGIEYFTKYVYKASTGYAFDSAIEISDISVSGGTVESALVSTASKTNDTLTITVSWPATATAASPNWADEIKSSTDTWDNGGTISTAEELAQFAYNVNHGKNYVNKTITLANDIDLSDKEWTPIGTNSNGFKGTFDGKEKKITGIKIGTIDAPNSTIQCVGLFGCVDGGKIKNLGVKVAIYSSKDSSSVGGLVGINKSSMITNSYATGNVTGGGRARVGGLVGANESSMITNSYATGNVTGGSYSNVGGLAGYNYYLCTITNSYATGNVAGGSESLVGGLVGGNESSTITNSYATGNVTGDSAPVGGLTGANGGTITNSYATGNVAGGSGDPVGGLTGFNLYREDADGGGLNLAIIKNCYWNDSAMQTVGGTEQTKKGVGVNQDGSVTNVIGMTSSDMQAVGFVNTLNTNVDTLADTTLYKWKAVTNDYPTFVTNEVITSTISGTIKDKDGNPVSGATVTLTPNAGTPNSAMTGTDGKYAIENVPDGSYTIKVTLPNGGSFTKDVTVPGDNFDIKQPAETTYSVSGTVKDNANNPSSDASVKLMKGNTQIGTKGVTTNANGEFTITGAPNGTYNLVVSKNGITVTTLVVVNNANNTLERPISLPSGKTNSVVEVKPSTPSIVVGGLETQFKETATENNKGVTSKDNDVITKGGSVELKLTAEKKDSSATNASDISTTATADGKTVGIFVDLSVIKSVKDSSGDEISSQSAILTELPSLIEVLIPLDSLQGKNSYVVYRYHGTSVDTITTTAKDGEKIELIDNGATLKLTVKKFSTYAIAYTTPPTPITPPTNNTGGGSGGHSGASAALPTITTEPSEGGKITISNDKKIATITPNDGYVIADVMVDGKSVGTIEKYTFTDSKTHKINAVFVKKSALAYYNKENQKVYIGFSAIAGNLYKYVAPTDVTVEFKENQKNFRDNTIAWAKPSIDFVAEREIFLGTDADRFSPNESMTRAMFVTAIGRLYERSYGSISGNGGVSATSSFYDVNANDYYAKYVAWANENGMIKGIGENKFAPNEKVTREQMAVIMLNFATYLKKTETTGSSLAYADSTKISTWAIDGAKYCQETKVITGRDGGTFAPQGNATRAEVAAVIERFIKTIVK